MDPSQAVQTLSTTAWGAILVIMAVTLGSVIYMLLRAIRALHKENQDLAANRVSDLNELHDRAQAMARESLEAVKEFVVTIRDLKTKVCKLEEAVDRLKEKVDCRLCPARPRNTDRSSP
jgi:uncharacterized protein HemX